MSNWCTTKIAFISTEENLPKLKEFRKNIVCIYTQYGKVNTDWNLTLLSMHDILDKYNIQDEVPKTIRGYIYNIGEIKKDNYDNNYVFVIEEYDENTGCIYPWKLILETEIKDSIINMLSFENEPYCEIYRTSDKNQEVFIEKYCIDIFDLDDSIANDVNSILPDLENFTNDKDATDYLYKKIKCEKKFKNPIEFSKWFDNMSNKHANEKGHHLGFLNVLTIEYI